MTISIGRAAQMALDVQNACNLSGVVASFNEVMEAVRQESFRQSKGTDWINRHPVCQAFASKIADLAGLEHKWPTGLTMTLEELSKYTG